MAENQAADYETWIRNHAGELAELLAGCSRKDNVVLYPARKNGLRIFKMHRSELTDHWKKPRTREQMEASNCDEHGITKED